MNIPADAFEFTQHRDPKTLSTIIRAVVVIVADCAIPDLTLRNEPFDDSRRYTAAVDALIAAIRENPEEFIHERSAAVLRIAPPKLPLLPEEDHASNAEK